MLDDGAFSGCDKLESVTIPDSLTYIGVSAFQDCVNLTSIEFSDSVKEIENFAFQNCTSLRNINIPDSITTLGTDVFLDSAVYTNTAWEDGALYIDNWLIKVSPDKAGIFTIKDGTRGIACRIFIDDTVDSACENITEINIPDSVKHIGPYAFVGILPKLTNINLGNGVVSIDDGAFWSCDTIEEIIIPDSVQTIGEMVFRNNALLNSISIGSGVKQIGASAFVECDSLLKINVSPNNMNYTSENGVLFDKDKTTLILYPANKPDKEYTIPVTVKKISEYAFENCGNLTDIYYGGSQSDWNKIYISEQAINDGVTIHCTGSPQTYNAYDDYPQKFWDVPKTHWAFENIAELVDRGVINGYEDGSFKPSNTVSRAEWSKIMVGAAGLQTNDKSVRFSDMKGHWAIPYVNAAKDYLTAYSDNTFRPNQAAVREDVTVAMVKLKGYDVSDVDYSYLSKFTDTDSISNNMKAYVAVAVEKGLISGFEDNTFRGQATLTRAEAATLLWRAFQYGSDNKVVDTATSAPTDTPVVSTVKPTATPKPKATAKPTATPKPKATAKPKQTVAPKATSRPTLIPRPTPSEDPTPEPESRRPYVADTVANASIEDTWHYMATDFDDTLYYYDYSDNSVYEVDMRTENVSLLIDLSDFKLSEDVMNEFEKTDTEDRSEQDTDDMEEVTEYYKDYVVSDICYDTHGKRLICIGNFAAITDYYGLGDASANKRAILDITSGDPKLCADDALDGVIVHGTSYNENIKFVVKDGNGTYMFKRSYEGDFSVWWYYNRLYKANYNTGSWDCLRDSDLYGNHLGFLDNKFYIWDTYSGEIITCALNAKLEDTGINTRKNVEVLDFTYMPIGREDQSTEGSQIFISNNGSIFFYDEDVNAIRVIKER